jgi:hypothetical protein
VTTGNPQLAERARAIAARAPRGTLERRAAGCVAVALGTTGTLAAARKVLGAVEAADSRDRATEILAELAGRQETAGVRDG